MPNRFEVSWRRGARDCQRDRGDAYRVVYAVTLPGVVYVLHAFKKKSTSGIATPRQQIELIKKLLNDASDIHAKNSHER